MGTILDKIIANKRVEIETHKRAIPISHIKNLCIGLPKGRSLKNVLLKSQTGIISEFKRKSPSKGIIHKDANIEEIVKSYVKAGCSGISVLTDFKYFGGTINDFKKARASVDVPLLRKDFIVDPYQLYVAKALGADVILLIAAVLTLNEAYDLGELAHKLGMEVLLEIHTKKELEYISRFTDIVGVNNRNLKIFKTNIQNSLELAQKLPLDMVKISESGIKDVKSIKELKKAGFNGFLMGETFMKENKPGEMLEKFIYEIKN